MTTYAELEEKERVRKAPYIDPQQSNQTINAASMIYNEQMAAQINKVMTGKAKVIHFDVDDIQDQQWVADTLYSQGHVLDDEDEARRFWSTADRKFEDTTLGGNYVCNPRPGYTPWADPPKPGLLPQRNVLSPLSRLDNIGMGPYYSEALDDNYQVIDVRFGKPEYNSLMGYLLGHFSAKDALIANTGTYSPLWYNLGVVAGTAGLFVLLGPLPAITVLAVSYVGGFVMGIIRTNPHKFYYIRPTMYLYWKTVSNIVNQIMSYKGLYSGNDANPTTGEKMPQDTTLLQDLQAMAPGIFDENGAVNVRRVINKAERINQQMLKLQEEAASRSNSYEQLRQEMRNIGNQLERDPAGMSEEQAFNLYSKGVAPEAGGDDTPLRLNTVLMGTAEERFSEVADQEQMRAKMAETYSEGIAAKVGQRLARFWEYLNAEMGDGSAFATFRVDHNGPASETFSHSTMKNDLGEKFNSLSAQGRAASFSFAGGNIIPTMDEITNAAKNLIGGVLTGMKLDGLLSLAGAAYADIPEGWENAAYSGASFNYTMRLVSPYGHPLAQLQHIYIPLAMILAGVFPHAAGKAAYTMPFFCEVYDRGRGVSRTAILNQVVVTRGVSNLGFTRNKDMLAVDIQFSFKELSSALYMPIEMGMGLDPKDSIHTYDSTYSDYIATLGSATLGQNVYKGQKLRIRARQYLRTGVAQATSVDHWASWFRDLPGVRDLDFLWADSGRGN